MSAKELNIGDYVRTTDGEIGKIIECPKVLKENYGNWLWFETMDEQRPITKEYIIKNSPNIIDLIEVGDYVNGYLVKGKTNDEVIVDYYCYSKELCDGHYLHWHKDYIETIVTKEQFESMEYKIRE